MQAPWPVLVLPLAVGGLIVEEMGLDDGVIALT